MTSFLIKAHEGRKVPVEWRPPNECAFCRIIDGGAPATRVFENDKVIAILDILPLRPGHTLVIPKVHCPKVSQLPPGYAAATGEAVSKVANALTHAVQNTALNIVCNQEYAQAVPHVHYHIIPAPNFSHAAPPKPDPSSKVDHVVKPLTQKEMHAAEFQARDFLEEEDAVRLQKLIKAHL